MVLQDFLTQLTAHMGIESAKITQDETDDAMTLSIECDENESGLLIGRHAETLESIQHIARLLYQKDIQKPLIININDFRQHREEYLKDLAARVASKVVETGRPQILRLSSHERRVIHMSLADHPDVTTESEGEGIYRVLKVLPKDSSLS